MEMFCAFAATAKAKSASARMMSRIVILLGILLMAADSNAKLAQRFLATLARRLVDAAVNAAAVAVHRHHEGAEAAHTQLPERLGIEVIQVHVLDRFDPGRLERGRAADDGEIGAAQLAKSGGRVRAQSAFADYEAH